jgi:hypothetical protein
LNFELARNLSFRLTEVIHIGAHKFEESDEYVLFGTKEVFWIDPVPQSDPKSLPAGQKFLQIAVANVRKPSLREFRIFTATGFSSFYNLIQPKSLLRGTPPCEKVINVKTNSLSNVIAENHLNEYRSLVIDTQGSEFEILLSVNLEYFNEIIVETSRRQLYENEKSHTAVNELLLSAGFHHNMNDSDFFFGHGDQYYSRLRLRYRFQFLKRTANTCNFVTSLIFRMLVAVNLRIRKNL